MQLKYRGYLDRQRREIEAFKAGDGMPLPASLSFSELTGVSTEELQLLSTARPDSVHAASRIPGVRPSTLLLLFQRAKKLGLAHHAAAVAGS